MNDAITQSDREGIRKARESFSGQNLTEFQADIVAGITGILDRHIHKTGSFKEPLRGFANEFARYEKFDTMKADTIIRDFYAARYGRTMNATRTALLENEKSLPETAREQALQAARQTLDGISQGENEPFYKTYDREGCVLARSLNISENGAKHLMTESYRAVEGRELYETGKALEEKYHRPKIEAARQTREQERAQRRVQSM